MIIVEGPDGAGKTTLVERLQGDFGFYVGKRGTEDRDKLWTVTRSDTYRAISDAVRGEFAPIIWDRLFFSEMIYAPISNRKCEFSDFEQRWILRVLKAIGCPVILCYPNPKVIEENVLGEGHQMGGVKERITEICARYTRMFMKYPSQIDNLTVMCYDYTGGYDHLTKYVTYDQMKKRIEKYVNERTWRSW